MSTKDDYKRFNNDEPNPTFLRYSYQQICKDYFEEVGIDGFGTSCEQDLSNLYQNQ